MNLDGSADLPGVYLAPTDGAAPQQTFPGWRSSRWARDGKSLLVEVGVDPNSEREDRTIMLPLGADSLPFKGGAAAVGQRESGRLRLREGNQRAEYLPRSCPLNL